VGGRRERAARGCNPVNDSREALTDSRESLSLASPGVEEAPPAVELEGAYRKLEADLGEEEP